MDGLDLVPFGIGHVPETVRWAGCELACKRDRSFRSYPLSLRIPALLIRIVIPPNASKADLMTAAPSVTDEVFTTALPPTIHHKQQRQVSSPQPIASNQALRNSRTPGDFVHDLLGGSGIEVVHDNICSPRSKQQRVTTDAEGNDYQSHISELNDVRTPFPILLRHP